MNDVIIIEPRSNESILEGWKIITACSEVMEEEDKKLEKMEKGFEHFARVSALMIFINQKNEEAAKKLGFRSWDEFTKWIKNGNNITDLLNL